MKRNFSLPGGFFVEHVELEFEILRDGLGARDLVPQSRFFPFRVVDSCEVERGGR